MNTNCHSSNNHHYEFYIACVLLHEQYHHLLDRINIESKDTHIIPIL